MKAILFFSIAFCTLSAQTKSVTIVDTYDSSFIVLYSGAGLGFFGLYLNLAAVHQTPFIDFGIRYLTSRELDLEISFGGNTVSRRPIQYISELDILIGKTFYYRGTSASFFTGISVVGGTLRGNRISESVYYTGHYEFEHLDKTVLGIPLEIRLAIRPSKYVDIGISAFANINRKKFYKSFPLSVQLALPL